MSDIVDQFRRRRAKPPRKRGRGFVLLVFAALAAFAVISATGPLTGRAPVAAALDVIAVAPAASYGHCSGRLRVNCVVDGDTLWSGGVKIRIADIDTPEVGRPRCASEKALGDRATIRMIQLVNAGPFELRAWPGRDEDQYGRKLRVLTRDGRSLGDMLVAEGLARAWTGRRQPWC